MASRKETSLRRIEMLSNGVLPEINEHFTLRNGAITMIFGTQTQTLTLIHTHTAATQMCIYYLHGIGIGAERARCRSETSSDSFKKARRALRQFVQMSFIISLSTLLLVYAGRCGLPERVCVVCMCQHTRDEAEGKNNVSSHWAF